jgi:hypothetical protein
MKKIILLCFCIIGCFIFLTSSVSASSMQYTRFSDLEYIDHDNFYEFESEFYNEEEVTDWIKESIFPQQYTNFSDSEFQFRIEMYIIL